MATFLLSTEFQERLETFQMESNQSNYSMVSLMMVALGSSVMRRLTSHLNFAPKDMISGLPILEEQSSLISMLTTLLKMMLTGTSHTMKWVSMMYQLTWNISNKRLTMIKLFTLGIHREPHSSLSLTLLTLNLANTSRHSSDLPQ